MLVNGNGVPMPIAGLTQFTPAIPKLYWDVDSQEQGIRQLWKVVEKLCSYANEICDQTNLNTSDIAELQKRFEEFVKHGFDDYYAEQLEQWFIDNAWKIYERTAKQVFFGLTDDGYFCAYVPESWKEIEFDTGAIYGTEEYGRLILRFAADGHGVINNTGYDSSVMTDTIDSRLMSAAGAGLNYANDQLNVNVADRQTFGGVKLKHEIDNDVTGEWAATSDGVYKYAPSKAETIEQPTEGVFTDILHGVTLTLYNTTRIGGLVAMNIRIQTDADTSVSATTRIARTPAWIKGASTGMSSKDNYVLQMDTVGISCNKSIEPNTDLLFWIIGKYNG